MIELSEEYVTRKEHEALKRKFEELERRCGPYMPAVSPHRHEEVSDASTEEEAVVSLQVEEAEEEP